MTTSLTCASVSTSHGGIHALFPDKTRLPSALIAPFRPCRCPPAPQCSSPARCTSQTPCAHAPRRAGFKEAVAYGWYRPGSGFVASRILLFLEHAAGRPAPRHFVPRVKLVGLPASLTFGDTAPFSTIPMIPIPAPFPPPHPAGAGAASEVMQDF